MKLVMSWLRIALPFIQMAQTILETLDSNTTGSDDDTAKFLKKVVIPGLAAIIAGDSLPENLKKLSD